MDLLKKLIFIVFIAPVLFILGVIAILKYWHFVLLGFASIVMFIILKAFYEHRKNITQERISKEYENSWVNREYNRPFVQNAIKKAGENKPLINGSIDYVTSGGEKTRIMNIRVDLK